MRSVKYSTATIRKISRHKRQRRKRSLGNAAWQAYVVGQVVVGGISGLLLGAIVLNAVSPGHPFYVAIRQTLCDLLGIPG